MHLVNDKGVWEHQNGPSAGELPPSLAPKRAVQIQDMRLVPLPAEMPAGKAYFEAGLYQADVANPKQAGPRVGIVDGEGRVVADQVNLGADNGPSRSAAGRLQRTEAPDGCIRRPDLVAWLVRRRPTTRGS